MIFNSLAFAAFILLVGVVLAIFNAKPFLKPERAATTARLRHGVLLVASYVFCGWFDWRFCLALAATTAVVYFCALGVARGKRSKLWLRLGVVLPLVALAVFKYFNFFVSSVAAALSLDVEALGTLKIILPIGISFYVFQAISYVVDVNRGKVEASSDFVKVALYLAFFPRLVSGPIVKAAYFFPQLEEKRNVGLKNLEIGVQFFMFGLFKKIVVADRLGAFVDTVYATPNAFHGAVVTLAVVSYALQLYFDFSGYSDMAVGVAKGLGYDLPRNFNLPYISRNPSELWKRWHISLSSWLMEYLYIPLGGNRKGKLRAHTNLMTTMTLGGLWHGASWAFVAWGVMHGAALCVHKVFKEALGKRESAANPSAVSKAFGVVATLAAILGTFVWTAICWIPFRAPTFADAWDIFTRMFVWNDGIYRLYVWTPIFATILLGASVVAYVAYRKRCAAASPEELEKLRKTGVDGFYPLLDLTKLSHLTLFMTFVYLLFGFAYFGDTAFVYAQF